ncbi:hypothetical protein [Sphingobium limneticum]|uniref:Uncharacterized protein n=1 Tax=Sphingobium limneticum TaxID=1007511 RepID=A0A5J5I8Y5_9SPHN|nr:hypothetical protein [Sphingobium limneticum]KAA9018268.1 hypothetical protein F4U96_09155 [Sphingobium limneticum]KAA9030904.1 hypothetical protein F4U95_09105 [Sphingobium limneticum]
MNQTLKPPSASDNPLPLLILKVADWIDIKPSSTFDTLKLVINAIDDPEENESLSDMMDVLLDHKGGYEWKFLDEELDDPDMKIVVTRHIGNVKAYRHIAALYIRTPMLKAALKDIL